MNAIGLDLSLTATGYATATGGLVTINPKTKADRPEQRLHEIISALEDQPLPTSGIAVIEGVAGHFHGSIGQKLAGLHWLARVWAWEHCLAVVTVAQTRLKKYATGFGSATKGEILEAAAVRAYEQHLELPRDFDQADAFWLRQIALDNQPEQRRAWAEGDDLDRYRASVLDDLWGEQ